MDLNRIYQLMSQKLSIWFRELIRMVPNILLAAIVLVAGLFIAKWFKSLATKFLGKLTHNPTINNLIISTLNVTFIGIILFTVLSILKLDKAVTSILAGAGLLGLALAFAFQDIAANFISGIFISFRHPFKVGDIVQLKEYQGKVEEINLRDTVLRLFQGQKVIIPNKDVFQNPIENFSTLGKRRIDITIGVSYGEDLEKVREVTLRAVSGIPNLSPNNESTLFYREFADSSINFILRLWVNSAEQHDYLSLGSEAIISIKKAYDANGIMIPFPVTTLDFGIKGGVELKEML
jgi:small conductance mechanosensitive channel